MIEAFDENDQGIVGERDIDQVISLNEHIRGDYDFWKYGFHILG